MTDLAKSDGQMGEAMAALNERQRAFVLALFDAPKSHGSGVFAAKVAGYGTPQSSQQTLASVACKLKADPRIQAAITEVTKQHFAVLGPAAVRGLRKILDNPKHREFGRAIGLIMDRVAPSQSGLVVEVKGEVKLSARETDEVLARIEHLAKKFMGGALPAPKIIEHEAAA